MRNYPFVLALILLAVLFVACKQKKVADLIIHNAVIYTVDSAFSVQEAMAIKDGKFLTIGSNEEIMNNYESGQQVDADGRTIYPGFYDAHCHFFGFAQRLHQVDLVGTSSEEELVARVQAFREKHPNDLWITGGGWDQNRWTGKKFPTHEALSKAFPDVPVYLRRVDGHAALANKKALELAGVTVGRQPSGGLIEQRNGQLTGMLIDNAMRLVQEKIPHPSTEEMSSRLLAAEKACLAVGLTTLADAGLGEEEIALLHKLYNEGKLNIREYAMIMLNPSSLEEVLAKGIYTSEHLDVRSFKIVGDGALGSRGACLLEPYADHASQGFLLTSPQELETVISKVAKSDFQLNIHAIGDSTNRLVLDLFNKYLDSQQDRRWRVEHAQILSARDFEKFARGIIPSIQPTHATSDMNWAIDRIGKERLKNAYAYKQLLEVAGSVAIGSDFPVEDINPLYGFHAAVARVDEQGMPSGGFQIEHALSREEALKGMTIWAAYACFQNDSRGSIEEGKLADFVMLNNDIMKIPLEDLRDVDVLQTFIGGESVFKKEDK
ncbi:amidohydrolase [Olivibacter sp. SDN3]|uniref:amidohydrolase n=1 Tax=Olivibacter sp. SDN3 TaxID=2764720 RepID=UPI0016518F20|nr:amidohydrolase [Olivibacter sp. SDN3]QNL48852.1 amidohydrolase [Olivibacter sp. SDN3]